MYNQNPQELGQRSLGVHSPLPLSSYRPTRNQEILSDLRKARSFKKHFINNFHNHSELEQLGINSKNSRLETVHSKLDVRDIIGASADTRSHEIVRNKFYGKLLNLPTQSICQDNIKKNIQKMQPEQLPALQIPTEKFKPLRLQIDHTLNFQRVPSNVANKGASQRRVKTELEGERELSVDSRVINRWSPTFLTSNSNPFVLRLPKIS